MQLHDVCLAGAVAAVMLTAVVVEEPAAMSATAVKAVMEIQPRPECTAPPLSGHIVDVTLADMGSGTTGPSPGSYGTPGPYGTMTGGLSSHDMRMTLSVTPATVPAGTVSLRVSNKGRLAHEVVVLPLPSGQTVGQRVADSDEQRIDEAGSLGEASHNCAAGAGEGIDPSSMGWTTLMLRPGRYELVCNFPGHYDSGMYAELNVTK
ncbi:Sulfocyanin (SoxE) domain-containing protein [Streptosporangium subroseum]|uniref:Sulfocyanin (SoxE) domain-containing protein n=1 Tax=Streptosporangium subroseum TaxID=106412 RepID=A0A239MMG4_9ACTN|nr:sulfocyanin-like copper-binding protein [Streptosporangium subroseum]SNT43168.1 Sulfocyanin (SoxE) domain-containing protein [Streptosporangium subroseum]